MFLCLMRPGTIPEMSSELWGIPMDKIAHFLMFFPYPVIAYITFKPDDRRNWPHLLVLLAVFSTGIGLAMGTEKLQGLSEYRSYEVTDFYADVLGMELSTFLVALYIIFRKKRKDYR